MFDETEGEVALDDGDGWWSRFKNENDEDHQEFKIDVSSSRLQQLHRQELFPSASESLLCK